MHFTLRNIIAFFLAGILLLFGAVRRMKRKALNGNIILSIYCHNPNKKFFESCVRWLLNNGFCFISIQELVAISRGEKEFPKGAVVITVDDGWKDNKENIAAIANKYKIPVTIFISTEPVATGNAYWWSYIEQANKSGIIDQSVSALKKVKNEERVKIVEEVKAKLALQRESLTIEEVIEISKTGFVSIGSHTITHPILINCTDEKAGFEISESRKIIEAWLNKKVNGFAYPNGNYTIREIDFLKASGYQMAFTTHTNYITPENISELYTIPRVDVIDTVSFAENICRMTGVWFRRLAQLNFVGSKVKR